jgi:CheY-like chemotaxis protein
MKDIESILVVEDSLTAQKYICDFLATMPVKTIRRAVTAEEALDILKTEQFTMILSDYRLPGMTGVQFIEHIRAQGNLTPALLLSSSPDTLGVLRASQQRVNFFAKPFRVEELAQAIERLVTVEAPSSAMA